MTKTAGEPRNPTGYEIPEELARHVTRESYSLLVKGDGGTGKTTHALSLLLELSEGHNFLFLATRASPGQIFEVNAWRDIRF